MPELADEELLDLYRSSRPGPDADAWIDQLFQRYHGKVALWCLRVTGNRETAADLAQDVFVKVFRNLDSFRGESRFSTWLYTVVRNHCYNDAKSRGARPEAPIEPLFQQLEDPAADPYEMAERRDSVAAARELMRQTLSDVENQVMVLHYGEELPLEAVTRMLRLDNASGAKAYIVSARRKLAAVLGRKRAQSPPPGSR